MLDSNFMLNILSTIDALDLEKSIEMYPEINTFKRNSLTISKNTVTIKDKRCTNEKNIPSNEFMESKNEDNNFILNETNNKILVNKLQKRKDNRSSFYKKAVLNFSEQPILQYQTITNENNNILSEINNQEIKKVNKIKINNYHKSDR